MLFVEVLRCLAVMLVFLASLPALYLGVTSSLALSFYIVEKCRRQFAKDNLKLKGGKFAFVIPAHNEEVVIARTIQSIRRLKDDNFSISVIADNCSDQTGQVASSNGAYVLERQDDRHKSKGHALAWAIPRVISECLALTGEVPLAIVVLDADATISPDSALYARSRFAHGANILQSAYRLERGHTSRSRVISVAFSAINIVRGYARSAMGVSDTFKGNGMWIESSILHSHPWTAYSLAEDLEFGLHLRKAGLSIDFFPESIVTGLPGESDQASSNQRARWEGGRLALVLRELPIALKNVLARPSLNRLDLVMELATPPLTYYGVILGLAWLLAYAIGGPVIIPTVGILCITFHFLVAMPLGGHSIGTLIDLAGIPFYLLWKIILLPRIWHDRNSKIWIRTDRS
jgi:cellulose synthase/poly-beta-1,6-N-acetylglucosamine synthase-like glycosyltransferase